MSTSPPETRRISWFSTIAVILALAGSGAMLYYHVGLFLPRMLAVRAASGAGNGYSFGDDFYPVWLTTRVWRAEHIDLYSPEMTRKIQTGLFGRSLDPANPQDPPADYRQFAYPAFTDLLLWPATLADFPLLRLLLVVALPVLTIASLRLWLLAVGWNFWDYRFVILTLLTLSSYQLLEALFAEQPGLLVGFFLASAMLALRRNRLALAGVLLSLTLIKPQMTLLAAAFLVLWSLSRASRPRLAIAFLASSAILMAASLWIWPRWFGDWLGILFGYHRYAMPPLVSVLLGASLSASLGKVLIGALIIVGGILAWRNRRADAGSPDFWLTLSLLLAITSVTLLPGQAIYDHIILIPGILIVSRDWRKLWAAGRVVRILLTLGCVAVFWQFAAACGLLLVRPLLAAATFDSRAVFTLPIRTAASLPFAVLALLVCLARINATTTAAPISAQGSV
jgi:hypothetical protein